MEEEEKLVELKRMLISRRAHRGQLTKLVNKADNIVRSARDPTEVNKPELQGVVDSMSTKITFIKELDATISHITAIEELEMFIVDADDFAEASMDQLRQFQNHAVFTSVNAQAMPAHTAETTKRIVNLPKLQLPTFDGNMLKWTPFFDAFTAAVDKDDRLDNIQKFQYLSSSLTGEAARSIEGLQLTNVNYGEALAVLKLRYGQKHKIIHTYMKALWELPKPSGSTSTVKDFYDNLETYIRGLRSLGKNEDSYGDLLVPIIFEKLPGSLKTQISREHGDKAWTLTEVQQSIYREIQAAEAGDISTILSEDIISSTTAFHIGNKVRPKNTSPFTQYTNVARQCAFCKGSHTSNECVKVADPRKRYDIARRDRLCFNCLRNNHSVGDCRSKGRCRNCHSKHHSSLCYSDVKQDNLNKKQQYTPILEVSKPPTSEVTHVKLTPTCKSQSGPILLKTATGTIWNNNSHVTVNILLDEGAQRTFITEESVNKLSMDRSQCRSEKINLSTFGADQTRMKHIDVIDLQLDTISGDKVDISALIVPKISTPVNNYVPSAVLNNAYLQGLPLAKHVEKDVFEIDLLIGADYYWSIVGDNIVRGSGPTAVATKLGYMLSGPTNLQNVSNLNIMIYKVLISHDIDERNIATYWDLETIGIKDESDVNTCEYDKYCESQLSLENGKYTAKLPWKDNHPPLPTNFYICNRRTRAMVKRLPNDLLTVYDGIISEQLSRGFIEVVPNDDNTQGHYIPHHAVHRDSLTTPIRVVYDCSCSHGCNASLNDCLDTGPCLLNDLVAILIRFRLHPVAFTSDIEKAFLNIQLCERDRDYTKFLWLSEPNNPDSDFTVYRFKAVLFGSVSSPFILNAVVKTHLEKESNTITNDLANNIYVDNLLSGANSEEEAIEYYKHSIDVLHRGGFNLRSWATNNATLNDVICNDNKQDKSITIKVLGMIWNTTEDVLTYSQSKPTVTATQYTKRDIMRITSSLYDPLGMLSPVHIQAKIFIQELWLLHLGWDEPLSDDLVDRWIPINDDIIKSRSVVIPRQYFMNTCIGNCELHVFADASMQAYGAVVYIKHNQETTLVISKSRVKPLKDITLPRLELLAAFIATHLTHFVIKALSHVTIENIVLWCDSQIVLHWIQSNKKLPLFVANRVKAIKQGPFTNYKYCPSADNPADLLTRGITLSELNQSNVWTSGPSWLPRGDWPICDLFDSTILTCACQTNDCDIHVSDLPSTGNDISSVNMISQHNVAEISNIIDITRYSSLGKLLRVTSYVLRFISILKNQHRVDRQYSHVTVQDLNTAENLWIKCIQQNAYSKELDILLRGLQVKSSLVNDMKLFLDDSGLIRCGGRLQNANIGFSAKHPVLLPPRHVFTKLVILHAHSLVLHAGLETTISFIRNTFWISRLRRVVKAILHSCVICLKVNGRPYKMPVTPPLPQYRLDKTAPFTTCGVDFTGALLYKTSSSISKAYICLFTCTTTRAIHLEVVTNMSADSFLRAFRRFAARCSLPSRMISDNGTTFIAAAEDIRNIFRNSDVHDYLSNRNVEWTFIPKRAPWFGGFYERLIGITKNALKKTLGRALVTLDELCTIIVEIEAVINERPITYVSSELNDPEALTPSMLLYGRSITILPHKSATVETLQDPDYSTNRSALTQQSKRLGVLIEQCWTRWKGEYLPSLRESHCANEKNRRLGITNNCIKVGDVVLVHQEDRKRTCWPLAVVTSLISGSDGLVRSARIRTKRGTTNRPIIKLFPLEVASDEPVSAPANVENIPNTSRPDRTRRKAAIKARHLIEQCANLN